MICIAIFLFNATNTKTQHSLHSSGLLHSNGSLTPNTRHKGNLTFKWQPYAQHMTQRKSVEFNEIEHMRRKEEQPNRPSKITIQPTYYKTHERNINNSKGCSNLCHNSFISWASNNYLLAYTWFQVAFELATIFKQAK